MNELYYLRFNILNKKSWSLVGKLFHKMINPKHIGLYIKFSICFYSLCTILHFFTVVVLLLSFCFRKRQTIRQRHYQHKTFTFQEVPNNTPINPGTYTSSKKSAVSIVIVLRKAARQELKLTSSHRTESFHM